MNARHLTRCIIAIMIAGCGAATFVQAAVTVNCTASVSGIAFGIYNPLNAVSDASTGSLKVTCNGSGSGTVNVTLNVTLSTGMSGTYSTRKMFSGANALNYNIFWSAAYNQIIGDGTGGSFAGTAGPFPIAAGGSNTATGTLYGLIPASQDVVPGAYSDVITVTVTY
jgi:spore coat protein U-like protein